MTLLTGALAVIAVSEVLSQLPLVMPQFVAVRCPLMYVTLGFGFVPPVLLPILVQLLEIVLQVGGIAGGDIGLDRFPVGTQVVAILVQVVFVVVQGVTIMVQLVMIVLDRMGLRILGLNISREPDHAARASATITCFVIARSLEKIRIRPVNRCHLTEDQGSQKSGLAAPTGRRNPKSKDVFST